MPWLSLEPAHYRYSPLMASSKYRKGWAVQHQKTNSDLELHLRELIRDEVRAPEYRNHSAYVRVLAARRLAGDQLDLGLGVHRHRPLMVSSKHQRGWAVQPLFQLSVLLIRDDVGPQEYRQLTPNDELFLPRCQDLVRFGHSHDELFLPHCQDARHWRLNLFYSKALTMPKAHRSRQGRQPKR